MTIDDPTLHERPFTETHDRILHALVEQVHALSGRVAALEARDIDLRDHTDDQPTNTTAAPQRSRRTSDESTGSAASRRPSGWQPTRR